MEATGSYGKSLANFLYENNHEVSVVNPLCIHAFAKSKLVAINLKPPIGKENVQAGFSIG